MTKPKTRFDHCARVGRVTVLLGQYCYCEGRKGFVLADGFAPCPSCNPTPKEARRRAICNNARMKQYGNKHDPRLR